MKSIKQIIVLLAFTQCVFFSSSAQKAANEITLVYNISVQSSSDKTEIARSLEGAVVTVSIKGSQSRSDMTSALGTESNLFDARAGKGFILKEYSGQKLMITMNKENWTQKNQYYQNLKFTTEDGEQVISGYKCRKAVAVLPNGKNITVYYTPEINVSNKQYNNAFTQLPGIPVQYELESGSMKFSYKLSKVSYEPVASSRFEVPKTGYRVMTYEENQQLKKGDKK
jgi:GLPGLI family protein